MYLQMCKFRKLFSVVLVVAANIWMQWRRVSVHSDEAFGRRCPVSSGNRRLRVFTAVKSSNKCIFYNNSLTVRTITKMRLCICNCSEKAGLISKAHGVFDLWTARCVGKRLPWLISSVYEISYKYKSFRIMWVFRGIDGTIVVMTCLFKFAEYVLEVLTFV